MKVIVDAFGGDNAPLEILKGCAEARLEYGCDIMLVGPEDDIRACAVENGIDLQGMEIRGSGKPIPVEVDPRQINREYKDCSMAVGLRALADGEGDAFVSAGSSGALVVGATHFVKRIKGLRSTALATVIPSDTNPYLLLDIGANVNCTPETLDTFAMMGSVYMDKVMKVENPRVGLANIGAESNKGGETLVKAHQLMTESDKYNFIGNVEFRDIPYGAADVVIADGFTGNVYLKTLEGTALMLFGNIKNIFKKNIVTKLAAAMIMSGLKELKKKFDFNEYGGAPLMGISKPVIKAHGTSKAKAFKNAIRQAIQYSESGVIDTIAENIPKKEAALASEEAANG